MSALSHHAVLAQPGGPVLTSRQQFTVLDRLLVLALRPLERESEAFYEFVAEVLAISTRSRRKNAAEMTYACTRVLTGASGALALLFGAGIDRGQALDFLRHVRVVHDALSRAELRLAMGGDDGSAVAELHAVRAVLGQSARLAPALTASAFWQDRALEWRNHIVSHYARMLLKGAASMNRASGGRIELDPTFHDAWIAAINASNRFRSDQATFTGFLGQSLKGTYRVAASNALGLAAPGARVQSDLALQTTVLDDAVESGPGLPHPLADARHDAEHADDASLLVLRALAVAAGHPDVRLALVVSEANPVEAMAAINVGPRAGVVKSSE